ncbi:hypothetical protein X975_23131, partial [Stegodyphus mimosarum]
MKNEKKRGQLMLDSDDINEAEQEKENTFSKYKFEDTDLKRTMTALSDVILDQPMNEKRINIQDNFNIKKENEFL